MAEPVTRGLSTAELSLVAAGLDALGRPDAAQLAVEVRNAAAVAVVQKAPAVTYVAPDGDDHLALGLAESAACEPTGWERWIDEVEAFMITGDIRPAGSEKLTREERLGRDVRSGVWRVDGDGLGEANGTPDPWSMDQFHDLFLQGLSPIEAFQALVAPAVVEGGR
jgi:hypothetical protein